MPEKVTCAACGRSRPVNDVLEVKQKVYCDKYCVYVDDPNTEYISVPQTEREDFAKMANAKVIMRSAEAQAQEALRK